MTDNEAKCLALRRVLAISRAGVLNAFSVRRYVEKGYDVKQVVETERYFEVHMHLGRPGLCPQTMRAFANAVLCVSK